jgi:hypothetical protein
MSKLGALFRQAKFMLRTEFLDYHVAFISRTCNKPAHALAALGLAGVSNDHQVWVDQVPADVSKALYGDSAVQVF